MKLAFNTWVYSSFPVWVPSYTLSHTIERVAKAGYDGIEIGAAAPHAYPDYLDAAERREIRAMLSANGLALAAMLPAPGGGPGFNVASPLEAERKAAAEQYGKVADLTADLGGDMIIYVAGWQVHGTEREVAFERSRTALELVAARAADRGVRVVVEPTSADSNLIDGCDDALTLVKGSGTDNVGLMFDTYHTIYRNEVPTDYVERMGDRLWHVHLADVDRKAPSDVGQVDYRGLVQSLKSINYKGYLSMEVGFDRRDIEADRIARDAHDYVRSLVGTA